MPEESKTLSPEVQTKALRYAWLSMMYSQTELNEDAETEMFDLETELATNKEWMDFNSK